MKTSGASKQASRAKEPVLNSIFLMQQYIIAWYCIHYKLYVMKYI